MPKIIFRKHDSLFYVITWWLLSTGIFLFTYIPSTNQVVLKIVVPFLLLLILGKEKSVSVDKGLWLYICLVLWGCLSLFYTVDAALTLRYLQGFLGNIIIWYIASRCIKNISDV
ncbi:MAG TPA: hypothetical protein VFF57_11475, partial [Hanamia sp.]|nr:hypothetical protein [Hanamia sp.]